MGYVTEIKELAPKEVQSECKSGHIGAKNHYRGCVLRNETPEGSLTIVYQKGDKEAYYHELAHVTCGPHHTGAYYRGIYTTR